MKPEAFAAERRERLTAADDALRPAVEASLTRYLRGEESWYSEIVTAASQVWIENFEAEAPGANYARPLATFQRSIRESLEKTSAPEAGVTNGQIERVTRWASTLAVNASTTQGIYSSGRRYKRWTTMNDTDVREIHIPLDGQIRPVGSTFDVNGFKLPYPGAPVGPPENWIECRCVVMGASRDGEAMTATTFAIGPEDSVLEDEENVIVSNNAYELANPDGTPYTGALIVLLPAADDPVVAASSEPAHITTIWMGEQADLPVDAEELEQAVRLYAQDLDGPVVVPVRERGTLGDDDADVVFLEPTDSLAALRDGLLVNEPIREAYDSAEQFPEWTPHVTLGYPERPARGEYDATEVTFDRIGLWLGGEHYDYPMGGTVSDTVTAAAVIDEEDIAVEPVDEEDLPDEDIDDDGPDEEILIEIPVHGVLAPEEVETGDGRGFRAGALSTRKLPIPLRTEIVSTHGGTTSDVVTIGRIDEAWRDEATAMWRYRGVIITTKEHAAAALDAIMDGSGTGVSIDGDMLSVDMASATEEAWEEAESEGRPMTTWYKTTRVAGLTIVPIPAFEEAYIALGHEFEEDLTDEDRAALAACGCLDSVEIVDLTEDPEGNARAASEALAQGGIVAPGKMALVGEQGPEIVLPLETFAPGTKDGPGWITHPQATARIRRYWTRGKGAAKVAWGTPGDFNRCRALLAKYVQNPDWLAGLCANMHKEVLGIWPGQHRGRHAARQGLIAAGGAPAPVIRLVASGGGAVYSHDLFREPDEDEAFGLRIDRETRRIWGYAAEWGSCHIGISGMCQEAPQSHSDYSYFRKGVVDTDQGEQRVGLITYGIGHASEFASAAAATAHYDKTDAVRAYINIGENDKGIWYSGVLAPWVTDADIDAMRAIGRTSGDWRNWSGRRNDLEMVGLVVVNTEGFQLAASGGVQTAAVGIGALPPTPFGQTEDEFVASVADRVIARIRENERREAAMARVEALRAQDALAMAEGI